MPQAKFALTLRLKLSDKKEEMGGATQAQFQTLSIKHIHRASSGNKHTRERAYFCLRMYVYNKDLWV